MSLWLGVGVAAVDHGALAGSRSRVWLAHLIHPEVRLSFQLQAPAYGKKTVRGDRIDQVLKFQGARDAVEERRSAERERQEKKRKAAKLARVPGRRRRLPPDEVCTSVAAPHVIDTPLPVLFACGSSHSFFFLSLLLCFHTWLLPGACSKGTGDDQGKGKAARAQAAGSRGQSHRRRSPGEALRDATVQERAIKD